MERISAQHCGDGIKSSWAFLLEGDAHCGAVAGYAYEKGVKVCGNEKVKLEQRLQRSHVLHWWDINNLS